MTDSRLQQLKRAWEASGRTEDEAAYLRERVRVGELSQERLELAAFCGNEGARLLREDVTPATSLNRLLRELLKRERSGLAAFAFSFFLELEIGHWPQDHVRTVAGEVISATRDGTTLSFQPFRDHEMSPDEFWRCYLVQSLHEFVKDPARGDSRSQLLSWAQTLDEVLAERGIRYPVARLSILAVGVTQADRTA